MARSVRALLAGALLLVAGCGGTAAGDVTARPPYSGPSTEPTVVPAAPGPVTTRVPVTVIQDDGRTPELCVGAVLDSLPPQCGGPPLVGWDWTRFPGGYQTLGTTTFGDFLVTGTFDGTRVTPTEVVAAADAPTPTNVSTPLVSNPCPVPSGGWVVDPGKVSDADEAVRSVWGGGLCVTTTTITATQLSRIKHQTEDVPGWLGSGTSLGHVDVTVLYDDGQTQAWADKTFGAGLVRVTSALTDVPR